MTQNVDEKSGGERKAVVGGRYGDAKCERDGRGDANCKAKCRSKRWGHGTRMRRAKGVAGEEMEWRDCEVGLVGVRTVALGRV